MAVTAIFSPVAHILSTFGDALDNTIELGRNAAGTILVNGGAVSVLGGTPTVANTSLISVFAQGGNDPITLNEANGALPRAQIFGGDGNDALTGGSGTDLLFGQDGNDVLEGKGGTDQLFGGPGNDALTGGDGDDQMFGEAGNDLLIWNPGDDTDLFEGGAGTDTAQVNGGNGAEVFTVTANGTRVRVDRVNPAPFAIDAGTMESVVINMNGGDDSFSAAGNLSALIKLTVDGGAGNDTILGSNGADVLLGGDGSDFVDGQQGDDVVLLGAGNDVFQWDPGDGSDVVEGQDGTDTMLFNGSGASEIMEVSANGSRARFSRNVGNIVMDLNCVEVIDAQALGGTDTITVNDLSGTNVTTVNVNLAGALSGMTGDAQADTVIVNGTNGSNAIEVFGTGTSASVAGLPALVNITNAEGATDSLVINGLGGDDVIRASTLIAGIVRLTVDAGAGADMVFGSRGADVILGGDGNDFVDGQQGDDVALLGGGDDVFQWDPGDGSDVVEGQDGTDTLDFNGSNASENIDLSANGGRVRFFRDVANITMDLNDVETIVFDALGGADNVVIGELTGTDVTRVELNLAGPNGGGDGQADTVTVNATPGNNVFGVVGSLASGARVFGLQAQVEIENVEGALDRLTLNGLIGSDTINATSLDAGVVSLVMNGGLGEDVFLGSAGDDLINGGNGNDLALMGAGDDTFVWNPGDDNDVLEGQAGFDRMLFNGNNAPENIDISANGGRVRFFRDVANVTMDLNDVEAVDFNAQGGADTIVVNDLSGTDITQIRINLAATSGAGDAQPDTIILNATNGDDVIVVFGDNSGVTLLGLTFTVEITGFDASDRVVVNGLAGDDIAEASVLAAPLQLVADGGVGDDVLIGSPGNDTLLGGEGDDVLLGGGGVDVLDGGPGDNILI
jgi:Ca2+-binding RTX toxin-like protein